MYQIDFLNVVSDDSDVCPYLPEQTARMPLCIPADGLSAEQFDKLLLAGFRRSGWFFYRTQCPNCCSCEPLRIEVANFKPSRSQRRAKSLGDLQLETQIAVPLLDERRLELFNRHRSERNLSHGDVPVGEAEYCSFLLNSYVEVAELSLWFEGKLIAVSITDVGHTGLSAVYCFFDPDFAWLSPGTYAILQQIELARKRDLRWLYLGMMVAENSHLKYKANYRPHERFIAGNWQLFE